MSAQGVDERMRSVHYYYYQHTSVWRGRDLGFDWGWSESGREGGQISRVESYQRMSGEGQSAFQ